MEQLHAIALLDEPARRRLYEWVVDQHRPVGREEAAVAVGVTRALAAFHLDRLAEAGLLATDYARLNRRTGPGAGRPARVYWRAPGDMAVTVPDRRYADAAGVLASAVEGGGAEARARARDAGRALGRRLGAAAGSRSRRGAPARLWQALADGGYEPSEPGEDGVIRLRNCPYDALVEDHREVVCGMNLAIAEGMLETVGDGGRAAVLDPQPGYCCVAFQPARER